MAVIQDRTDGTPIGLDGRPEGVLGLLQQAARTIDEMWHSAQHDGRHAASVALGEASYGIHRALIALRVEESALPVDGTF
jgi:hypothetical protein